MLVGDSTINTDIFSATLQQPAQLESLGNTALTRGIDLFMRKDFKGAVKEFQRAIGLAPQSSYSIDAAHYMADAYLALDDPKNAVKAYQTAIRLNPNRDDSHLKLGNLYFSEERFSEAASRIRKSRQSVAECRKQVCPRSSLYEHGSVFRCRKPVQQSA